MKNQHVYQFENGHLLVRVQAVIANSLSRHDAVSHIQRSFYDEIGAKGIFRLCPDDPTLWTIPHLCSPEALIGVSESCQCDSAVYQRDGSTHVSMLLLLEQTEVPEDELKALTHDLQLWKGNGDCASWQFASLGQT